MEFWPSGNDKKSIDTEKTFVGDAMGEDGIKHRLRQALEAQGGVNILKDALPPEAPDVKTLQAWAGDGKLPEYLYDHTHDNKIGVLCKVLQIGPLWLIEGIGPPPWVIRRELYHYLRNPASRIGLQNRMDISIRISGDGCSNPVNQRSYICDASAAVIETVAMWMQENAGNIEEVLEERRWPNLPAMDVQDFMRRLPQVLCERWSRSDWGTVLRPILPDMADHIDLIVTDEIKPPIGSSLVDEFWQVIGSFIKDKGRTESDRNKAMEILYQLVMGPQLWEHLKQGRSTSIETLRIQSEIVEIRHQNEFAELISKEISRMAHEGISGQISRLEVIVRQRMLVHDYGPHWMEKYFNKREFQKTLKKCKEYRVENKIWYPR